MVSPLWIFIPQAEYFDNFDFKGILSCGVIDQRSDDIESIEIVHERIKPVVEKFGENKVLLSSECGFGHVPLEITRAKLSSSKGISEAHRVF